MEECPSFKSWIKLASNSNSQELVKPLIRQLVETLTFLHGLDIYHRDIKVFNLLVEEKPNEYVLKLIDFGVAALSNEPIKDSLSSEGYTSPEQLALILHTPLETEVWQLGVFLYIVTYDEFPFGGRFSVTK